MSTEPEEINTQSTSDGVLEILGILSSFHIAQLQVGLNKPIRLGQAKSVKVKRDAYISFLPLTIYHACVII